MCLLVFKTSVGRESVLGEFDSHTPSPKITDRGLNVTAALNRAAVFVPAKAVRPFLRFLTEGDKTRGKSFLMY